MRSEKSEGSFTGRDILDVITSHRSSVGIVTLAPELPGGIDLVRDFVAAGHRVSIGHSGATYEEARAAIAAGVTHATHLYNRMRGSTSREPGTVGAVLEAEAVATEIICDGYHVHPSMIATAIKAKTPRLAMAITDATAGAGMQEGSRAQLGGRPIIVGKQTALLEDGTIAGSILTMDAAFRTLTATIGVTAVDAARMCATTPAERLGLTHTGRIAAGLLADLAVLGADRRVRQTYISGVAVLPEH